MKRTLFALAGAFIIMLSGSFIYQNPFFHKAENTYHIPQIVVEICDSIEVEGREVMAVFPSEMVQYVRQYNPRICMPYGREILIERWNFYNELYLLMEASVISVERLSELCKGYGCHYVILHESKSLDGDMSDYSYDFFDHLGGYDIYVDTTIYRGL